MVAQQAEAQSNVLNVLSAGQISLEYPVGVHNVLGLIVEPQFVLFGLTCFMSYLPRTSFAGGANQNIPLLNQVITDTEVGVSHNYAVLAQISSGLQFQSDQAVVRIAFGVGGLFVAGQLGGLAVCIVAGSKRLVLAAPVACAPSNVGVVIAVGQDISLLCILRQITGNGNGCTQCNIGFVSSHNGSDDGQHHQNCQAKCKNLSHGVFPFKNIVNDNHDQVTLGSCYDCIISHQFPICKCKITNNSTLYDFLIICKITVQIDKKIRPKGRIFRK